MPEKFRNLDILISFCNESSSTIGIDNSLASATIPTTYLRQMLLNSNEVFSSSNELLMAIVYCLSKKYVFYAFF